jgi:Putative MetA-pathway of phenol degradation
MVIREVPIKKEHGMTRTHLLSIAVLAIVASVTWAGEPTVVEAPILTAFNPAALAAGSLGLFDDDENKDKDKDKDDAGDEAKTQETQAANDIKAGMKTDKSGTNPINFTNDLRLFNEHQWLNTEGDGDQNVTTLEFRTPFADGKWQFRTRVRWTSLKADLSGNGSDDIDECDFGDMDIRFLTVPYFEGLFAFAYGLEMFLPTATDDRLSDNAWSLGPQVFLGFFKPFDGLFDLFAPGYQHKFSVYEENGANNVHTGIIDLYFVKRLAFGETPGWLLIDPQIILDYENHREFMLVDVEVGAMLDNLLGTKGHSFWVRPALGVGSDRPHDFSVEVGYKIIW